MVTSVPVFAAAREDRDTLNEILEDIREECGKYGTILDLKIPRPVQGNRQSPGIGKIFIKYEDAAGAQKAFKTLGGRQFQQRTVVVTYFGEVSILLDDLGCG